MTAERVEIPTSSGVHFITITPEGLEIIGEPSGEKTVISDVATLYSLYGGIYGWILANKCPAALWEGEPGRREGDAATNLRRLSCELNRGHVEDGTGDFHYARRYDETGCIVIGHHYWSDSGEPGIDYRAEGF